MLKEMYLKKLLNQQKEKILNQLNNQKKVGLIIQQKIKKQKVLLIIMLKQENFKKLLKQLFIVVHGLKLYNYYKINQLKFQDLIIDKLLNIMKMLDNMILLKNIMLKLIHLMKHLKCMLKQVNGIKLYLLQENIYQKKSVHYI